MKKYIVTIEHNKQQLPLTIKAESIADARNRVLNGRFNFDRIVDTEEQERYKSRMSKYVKYCGGARVQAKSSKRYLLG